MPREMYRIAIALMPEFSFMSLGSILAPLEYVKRTLAEAPVEVTVYSGGDLDCFASMGLGVTAQSDIEVLRCAVSGIDRPDAVFICCGHDVPVSDRDALRWLLRDCKRYSVRILGIGAATWILAEMGLLPLGQGAVHWSSLDAFSERHQELQASNMLFVSDGKVASCAGELATLDLVIDFLDSEFGSSVAQKVCDQFLVSFPRSNKTVQPGSAENRLRHVPLVVRSIVKMMRSSLDQNVSMREFANTHGISQRQMERIFKTHLGEAPGRYLARLRVETALQLCEQTEMALLDISLACGFSSPSLMSRHFKRLVGLTPREFRSRLRRSGTDS